MARMIPTVISPNIKSDAEKKTFKWFRDSSGTEDWVVFHSLGIAEHQTLIEGEVDFLVVAPKFGIFALEVKGGRVKRKDGMWHFTNRKNETTVKSRGPFEQASEGIHSIMTAVEKKVDAEHVHICDLLHGHGVMFPDIEYSSVGIEEAPWQVFDCNDNEDVVSFIKRLSDGTKHRWEEAYGNGRKFPEKRLPTAKDAKYLISVLRSDFDKVIPIKTKIKYAEKEFEVLTDKQSKCLEQLDENRRGVIYGPAGTGKTYLAIEQTKNSVAQGKKVALLCYNSSIGNWFESYFDAKFPELKPAYVGTFHKLLLNIVNKNEDKISVPYDKEARNLFYKEQLPNMAMETLLEEVEEFDEIIIDEAQDLIQNNYIDVMDLLIKKGFEHGRWKMFGDFSRQAIYSDSVTGADMLDMLEDRTSFIRYKLRENCRNTKQICEEIQTITGYEAPEDLWTKVEGLPVDHRMFQNEDDALNDLTKLLDELNSKEVENEQITILSPKAKSNSIVSRIENRNIQEFSFKDNKYVSFSTVQSFKGLENSVIILVDVDTYSLTNLMYVALSRAKSGLFIYETKAAHKEYNDLRIRRLNNA